MRPEGPQGLAGIVLTPIEAVSTTLERRLGFFSVVIISLSAMIGSGLFVLPSLAFEMVRGGAWRASGNAITACYITVGGGPTYRERG